MQRSLQKMKMRGKKLKISTGVDWDGQRMFAKKMEAIYNW